MDDLTEQIQIVNINGWKIQTVISGIIGALQDEIDGIYEIWIEGEKVVEIGLVGDDLLRITTKKGYAVQLITSEKIISVIKEARSE